MGKEAMGARLPSLLPVFPGLEWKTVANLCMCVREMKVFSR